MSFPPELHPDEWVRQHPGEAAEESAHCQETPAREDDSDTELTYGEVEQRLDLLQQHLNRCARAKGKGFETACWSCQTKRLQMLFVSSTLRITLIQRLQATLAAKLNSEFLNAI